jgi:prepilin-type N-terminal cleavage/methylation domain-containing protein
MTPSMKRAATSGQGGFTLLEVMVALGILAMTLIVLLEIVTNNVRATRHAKLTTAATFLLRGKMIDVEDQILENGFSTSDETAHGTFKDQGYPLFTWESAIERVELPADMAQKTKDDAQDKNRDSKDSANPMSMITGFVGGMMGTFIEPIRLGLQESVRRVTVRVIWDESGRPGQTIEVVQYLTDPSRLDAALTGGGAGALPGLPGLPGAAPGAPAGGAGVPSITPVAPR